MVMRWAACVALLVATPAFAQSISPALRRDRASVGSVREYVAAEAVATQLTLPPNLVAPAMYRPLLELILRSSPTFRRQCVRLTAETRVTVHLNMRPPVSGADIRAKTHMTRRAGHLRAEIDIFRPGDLVELIAHEIEHVIEQLDDIDLSSRAALRDSGVRAPSAEGAFETTRAIRVGLKVTGEVRASNARR